MPRKERRKNMGRKKVKDGQITFDDCVSHAISEPENGQVNMTLQLKDKPVEVITCTKKSPNLFVFTKKNLEGKEPRDLKNLPDGEFSIASGNLVSVKKHEDNAVDIVIESESKKRLRITMKPEDAYYKKVLTVCKSGMRVCALMSNDCCCDVKLGPIFGMTGWRFKKKGTEGKIATEYLVKAF